jgi:drug/metabolite transporter superfamily protein YnfA
VVIGGFIVFLYGVIPTFQPTYFHRIYATYGGIYIAMALLWSFIFEKVAPDIFDIVDAVVAIVGIVGLVICYLKLVIHVSQVTIYTFLMKLRNIIFISLLTVL